MARSVVNFVIMSNKEICLSLAEAAELRTILDQVIRKEFIEVCSIVYGRYWNYWQTWSEKFPEGAIICALKL
jgi:hypothetical protein